MMNLVYSPLKINNQHGWINLIYFQNLPYSRVTGLHRAEGVVFNYYTRAYRAGWLIEITDQKVFPYRRARKLTRSFFLTFEEAQGCANFIEEDLFNDT